MQPRVRSGLGFVVTVVLAACGSTPAPPPAHPVSSDAVQVVSATPAGPVAATESTWSQAQAVFETRCVVCHGCYDAPCQLKLESFEGVSRGATAAPVYDPGRVTAAEPTRLFVDAVGARAWRDKGFHAVLPQDEAGDPMQSVLARMLALKRAHPAPAGEFAKAFTFELDRKASCPKAGDFDVFAKDHPAWGMPYALPALSDTEARALLDWLQAGAPYPGELPLSAAAVQAVETWEALLNQPTPKGKLVGRYLYEHLFLASLYFSELDSRALYRLVRSRTPTGSPVQEIATRRPFDDPGEGPVYYRFTRRVETPLAKTHMPYALDAGRMQRWRSWFFDAAYEVAALPSYAPEISSNPFEIFAQIPAKSRYRFLLDEAQFTMMSFIKGPVCRGQIALNVIQERFWIAFLDPELPWVDAGAEMLLRDDVADMPAEKGSDAWLHQWQKYQRKHLGYVKAKSAALRKLRQHDKDGYSIDVLWDGDGDNRNAALTVMRHFDSATVSRGLLGGAPKTMWVIDYPLLERIHYLLAAGFDVFGNVSHQIMTRLYMDFLRMEGEHNFLLFMAPDARRKLIDTWYRGVDRDMLQHLYVELGSLTSPAGIRFHTLDPKAELLVKIEEKLARVRSQEHELTRIVDDDTRSAAQELAKITGRAASLWPEVTFIAVRDTQGAVTLPLTVLRDSAHTNVAELFREDARRKPDEDGLSVLRGFASAYPNLLLSVTRAELSQLVATAALASTPEDMRALRARFAVERNDVRFWPLSDALHAAYARDAPIEAGLFDYSRLDPPMTPASEAAR